MKMKSKYESDTYKHYCYEINGSDDYWMIQHECNVLRDKYGADKVRVIEIEGTDKMCAGIIVEVIL